MYNSTESRLGFVTPIAHFLIGFVIAHCLITPLAGAQPAANDNFKSAIELLPDATAGVVRIPDLATFCDDFKETGFGQLVDEESLQPFIEAQRKRARSSLESIGNKVGLRPDDLYDIASGEVSVAWLPFPRDKRRPYSACIVADVRGNLKNVEAVAKQIDQDLIAGGAKRKDSDYRGQQIRVYTPKPKPGQIKIEEIVLTWNADRIIAADRYTVVTYLLDAIAGEPPSKPISSSASYQAVMKRAGDAIDSTLAAEKKAIALEWFARPFQMGRILREQFRVDRGTQIDILKLLQNQGFGVIQAAGGIAALNTKDYDLIHRAFVYAPKPADRKERFVKAGNMLNFTNGTPEPIPDWVHNNVGTFFRLNWQMSRAFWAAETLVNEAAGDEMFRPMLNDIRNDSEGPQIDIEKNIIPYFDDQLILIGDNVQPASAESERMLVAIRVKKAEPIATAIRKVMAKEPDAVKVDAMPGIDIWKFQSGSGDVEEDELDIFSDLGLEEEIVEEEAPPLLNQWAVALLETGPNKDQPWLVFSSHVDLLVQTAKRAQSGAKDGLGSMPEVKQVHNAMTALGANQLATDRVNRPKLSLRTKYELLRQGKLKESDSVVASLLRRLFEETDSTEIEPIDTSTLPPINQIEKYLHPGGGYMEVEADGWMLNSFILK